MRTVRQEPIGEIININFLKFLNIRNADLPVELILIRVLNIY